MEQIYHLLITKHCDHYCPLCCNNLYDIDNLPTITGDDLRKADVVCITGGEPFILNADELTGIVSGMRSQYPNIKKVYIYTSGGFLKVLRGKEIGYMYRYINGINVAPKNKRDWESFARFIENPIWDFMPERFAETSNRLYVFEDQQDEYERIKDELRLDKTWNVIGRKWDKTFKTPENEHFVRLPILH